MSGSGKSQLAIAIALQVASQTAKELLYIDTGSMVDPCRFYQMAGPVDSKRLALALYRIVDTDDLLTLLQALQAAASMVLSLYWVARSTPLD